MACFDYAGCARKQGIFEIQDLCKDGNPPFDQTCWLLLSGAIRPSDIHGDRNGSFLYGITKDFANMEGKILKEKGKLRNRVTDLYMEKSNAVGQVRRHFKHCMNNALKPVLYYSGHGEIGTGNWCFNDGTLGIEEICDMQQGVCQPPYIVSDTCYSGHWANFCLRKEIKGFHCLAACPDYSFANYIQGMHIFTNLYINNKYEIK